MIKAFFLLFFPFIKCFLYTLFVDGYCWLTVEVQEKRWEKKECRERRNSSYNWYCFFWQFTCIKYNYQYYFFFFLPFIHCPSPRFIRLLNRQSMLERKRALINFLTNWISGLMWNCYFVFIPFRLFFFFISHAFQLGVF